MIHRFGRLSRERGSIPLNSPSRQVYKQDARSGGFLTAIPVPLEAVSGILATNEQWEREITLFWDAQKAVSHEPARSTACGTHIHITPGTWNKRWFLSQLRTIAVGIVRYDNLVQGMLPANRRTVRSLENPMTTIQPTISTGLRKTKHYCRSNTSSSESLNELLNSQGSPFSSPLYWDQKDSMFSLPKTRSEKVKEVQRIVSRTIAYMQGEDRYALWNFHNIEEGGTGTIEFRRGRGVRGLVRTKWWISFMLASLTCS
ncbi:hypothetical protein BBD39_05645 [Arsenophonus endosymbiont of Bemisia tabaci Asia II 3]|nr:hypothetical protein BBD39_05645 [Arsenophonus endosymbiont of Bemisia tabaci Asia II 3]